MHIAFMLLAWFPIGIVQGETDKPVRELMSEDWATVWRAKLELESLQEKAIPPLLRLLDRQDKVVLKNTADLIYPGAKAFYGHGFVVEYDLDWIAVRAGWVLEELTFRRFGFKRGMLRGDKELRGKAIERAKKWWKKASRPWRRFNDLARALRSRVPDRQVRAIGWIRYGKTGCAGLTLDRYRREILPEVKRLATAEDQSVRRQAALLLEDTEGYWLTLKGRK